MQADAFAKVNLSLRVRAPDRSGMHPLRSLAHSIDWNDTLELTVADEDRFEVVGSEEDIPADHSNLAMRALDAVRPPGADPVLLRLTKRIPAAAGLGGGSADAAAALTLGAAHFGGRDLDLQGIGAGIGADVPFCLQGGAALMEGHGVHLTPRPALDGFTLAVVVPPFELATADVYRRWDELGRPEGPAIDRQHLPDPLRDEAPLINDLTRAAVDLQPDLGDWIADLSLAWGAPAVMSGSGPALFGFFGTTAEAADAVAMVFGARAVRACLPVEQGVLVNT